MDKDRIVMSHIMLELTDGFKEWLALNITDCTANLDDRNSVFVCGFAL